MRVLRDVGDRIHGPRNEESPGKYTPLRCNSSQEGSEGGHECRHDCHTGGSEAADKNAGAQTGQKRTKWEGSNGQPQRGVGQSEVSFDVRVAGQNAGK